MGWASTSSVWVRVIWARAIVRVTKVKGKVRVAPSYSLRVSRTSRRHPHMRICMAGCQFTLTLTLTLTLILLIPILVY